MKTNPSHRPPSFFHRFFLWYCKPELRDHIEGDLLELYQERIIEMGDRKANLYFIIDVLLLFRPGIIKTKREYPSVNNYAMWKSYFKIGWRRILRAKGYSAINIGGLAVGMAIAIFIGLWIHDELSFNKYHKNYNEIGQVWSGSTDQITSKIVGGYSVQMPLGKELRESYPHLFKHVLLSWWPGDHVINSANEKFKLQGMFIQTEVMDMLTLEMIKGSYGSLNNMNSVVISQSAAKTLFGNEDPVGKKLNVDNRMDAEVTGVYADIPRNNRFSDMQFFSSWDLWLSVNDWAKRRVDDWDNRPFNLFVQLQPGVKIENVNAAIRDVYRKKMPADYYKVMEKLHPFIQVVPMSTWHLRSEFVNGKPAEGRITFVWLFGIIGVFVLILACINFINLSTARSEKRAREVGVRKAVGSGKSQLVSQFLSESFLIVLLSFIVSIVLVISLRNWFNNLSDKDISLPFTHPVFWLMVVGFMLITGFIAGIYPAFYLSSFQAVKVLKGALQAGRSATLPRRILVVVQFTVSVIMIIGTVVVYQQIQFARSRPIGYDKNNLITFSANIPAYRDKLKTLNTELLKTGMVTMTAGSSSPVTNIWNSTNGYNWPGKDQNLDAEFAICNVTPDFGRTVGWEIIFGRDFSPEFATDSSQAVVINEAAVKYMKLKDPVGQILEDTDEFGTVKRKWVIIGVVKDLVMESPYEPATETLFYYNDQAEGQLHLRLNPNVSAAKALPEIKKVFASVVPAAIFDYQFVDEEYGRKFSQEVRVGKLSGVFTVLAVFISCLGLFGLASYTAERRVKEIGIRKVMGATVSDLWRLLSKDFVVLVFISCVIAIPAGYFLMDNWLQKFQYRTNIPLWIFLFTSVAAILITLLTVSYQAIKAAMLNPVKSLRSE